MLDLVHGYDEDLIVAYYLESEIIKITYVEYDSTNYLGLKVRYFYFK